MAPGAIRGVKAITDVPALEQAFESFITTAEGKQFKNELVSSAEHDGAFNGDMKKYAEDLDNYISWAAYQNFASSADSILRLFDSSRISDPEQLPDGAWQVRLYFTGDLHRSSLNPTLFPSGVDNIVTLMIRGWSRHPGKHPEKVWGKWHDRRIHAKPSRPGMDFLRNAVDEFNRYYGIPGSVTAVIEDEYS